MPYPIEEVLRFDASVSVSPMIYPFYLCKNMVVMIMVVMMVVMIMVMMIMVMMVVTVMVTMTMLMNAEWWVANHEG